MRFHPLLVLLAFLATHVAASPRVALMVETFATRHRLARRDHRRPRHPRRPLNPPTMRLLALCALLLSVSVFSLHADSALPLVAIPPAVLLKQARGADSPEKQAAALSELVQLTLASDPAHASVRFVERADLDTLLREQALSLSGSTAATSAIRAGRLLHADWILRLRLRADDLARPRLEADVIDALRADLLARVETALETLPDESWLLRPSPGAVRLTTDLAARALADATSRSASLSGHTTLAPLVFLNTSGTDRLAPLAATLHAALRDTPHASARALGFDDPDSSLAESSLARAGLTDLAPEAWARVADAYLWGEFRENTAHVGAAADTPVHLRLSLWREGDAPFALEFTGRFGSLDRLAREAASAALDAATGARLQPSVSARRAAADRLLAAARQTSAPADETPSARRAHQEHVARLTELAAFFAPEDTLLVEQHITLRRRLAATRAEQLRWTRAFWAHFDRHLARPDGRPDLDLIARAADHDAAAPGLGPRFARIGAAWLGTAIDEPAALALWKKFAQAIDQLPDEPGLPAAIEALWPTVSRLDPALDPAAPSSDYGLRNTLAKVYRSDPGRARELLAGRLIPPAPRITPATAVASPPPPVSAAPPRPAPRATHRSAPPPSGVLSPPWEQFPPEVLVERVNQGPLVSAPALHAPALELTPPLTTSTFINTLATDGAALWIAFTRTAHNPVGTRRRAARIPLAHPTLESLPALVEGETEIADLWLENPHEVWLATRGEGLRVFDPASGAVQDLRAASGLPRDSVRSLARGHQALFIGHDQPAATASIPRVELPSRAISQVAPDASPDLLLLTPAVRAAIASYPDSTPPLVRLPAQSALAWSVAGPAPAFDPKAPPSARMNFFPPNLLNPHAAASPESDPSLARLACLTGARDGYWIAGLHGVAWASGTRRIPLAHWLRGHVFALADDGRRLFVLIVDRPLREFNAQTSQPPSPDSARLYAYDHHEGRWLGWLPLPRHGALVAAQNRLVLFLAAHTPILIYDTAALRPATPAELTTATAPPSAAQHSASARLRTHTPSDARALYDAARQGDFPRFETLLSRASLDELNRPFPDRGDRIPLGLATLQALLKNSRADLAHRLLDHGIATPLGSWDHRASDDNLFLLAVRSDDASLVIRLRRLGYGPPASSNANPLHEAIARKNAPVLRALLAPEPRADAAAASSDRQLAKIDPDLANPDGRTPLFAAADIGWTEGVRLLLDAGARSLHGDHATGRSLRDAAAPWPEVAVLLNRRPGSPDNHLDGARAVAALHRADSAALATLALPPAVLRYRDFWDWTVLHHAARHGRADLVGRLLAAGAEPDTLTGFGESALCLAAHHDDPATLSTLLDAGADPNRHRGFGWLPLHVAANTGRPDLVRLLLAARADPRPVVGKQASPILVLAAATRDDEQSLPLLVEAGAPLHATDADGFGPLEAAVISDSPAKLQYLLDRGARWQKPLGLDYHPMDAAAKRGLLRSLRKLQELGLQSPRALSLAEDDATRALLQDDTSPAGRQRLLDEQQWRVVFAEPAPARRRERVLAHLAAGADPSHLSAEWGTPLDLAVSTRDIALVRLLVEHGADPSVKSKGVAGNQLRPRTSLQAWLGGQISLRARGEAPHPGADEFALACLPIFWPHEPDPELREEMLAWAEAAGLTRTAAWMRKHVHAPAP